jgi:hypothetical protein
MKRMVTLSSLILVALTMASCTFTAPEPTLTATFTPLPTETPLPTATKTPLPPTPTEDIAAALVPVGTPDAEWNGIPIMPEAIAGEGDDGGYTFTVQATPEEIQAYYERELTGLGFGLLAAGDGENGSLMLIFMKGAETISVSVFPYQDMYVVLIVK